MSFLLYCTKHITSCALQTGDGVSGRALVSPPAGTTRHHLAPPPPPPVAAQEEGRRRRRGDAGVGDAGAAVPLGQRGLRLRPEARLPGRRPPPGPARRATSSDPQPASGPCTAPHAELRWVTHGAGVKPCLAVDTASPSGSSRGLCCVREVEFD